ncbi:MAG TPA: hypothetical protein VHX66_10160 [Solirubrobacteraceae bacterium]|jgi:hypothetical protein|nr:hypothetical protein [Solirubrobacteraceae bacterium]
MRRRAALAIACAAALACMLTPGPAVASASPPPASCLAFAHGMGTLLGNGATLLRDAASGYVPLIEQAAEAGIDNSASEIDAVAKKTSAVDQKLAVLVAASRKTTKQVVADGKACGAAPSCHALTTLGGQILGVLATASGDAGSYRSLIVAAAKAGHDENVKAVDALVAREERTTTAIAALDNKLVKLESNIHGVEAACHG